VPYAFVSAGPDSSLHYVWWNKSGSSWSDLCTPGTGRHIKNSIGATTVQDNSKAQQRPHVYVLASGSVPNAASVWLAWWDGANWQWSDLGLPAPAVAIISGAGALSVQGGPGSPQYPRAFVLGGNGHLYMHAIGGASPGWTDHGAPGGVTGVLAPVGTVAVQASSRAASVVYAFVLSADGQVCVRWGNDAGAGWVWQHLGSPGVAIICGLGAVALEDAGSAEQHPCGYGLGVDGAVYGVKLVGGLPCWQKEGPANRDAAGWAVGPVGAVAVHYPPLFTPAFPFIFARGNSGALLCDALDEPGWAWSDPGFPGAAS
jgi:hypothetical protein